MESRGWVGGEGETRGVGRWACRRVCLCMPRTVRFSLWISKEVFVYVYTVFTVYIDIVLFSVFYSLCTVLPLLTVSSSEFHQLYTRAVHDHLTRGTALLSLQNIHLSIKIHRSMHLYECSPYQKKKNIVQKAALPVRTMRSPAVPISLSGSSHLQKESFQFLRAYMYI